MPVIAIVGGVRGLGSRYPKPRTAPTWACSAAGVPAATPARASPNWPPPQPASCSTRPPVGSAAPATRSNAMATLNGKW
jgi:hypothetical protein